MSDTIIDKLIELGADKLSGMPAHREREEYEEAHYYKGGFQALKEAAQSLCSMESHIYRAECMTVISDRRHTTAEDGEAVGQ